MVGDTLVDVNSAVNFGGSGCLVKTGWGHFAGNMVPAEDVAAYIGEDLMDVVNWILYDHRKKEK